MPSQHIVAIYLFWAQVASGVAAVIYIATWLVQRWKHIRDGNMTAFPMKYPRLLLAIMIFSIASGLGGLWFVWHTPKPKSCPTCPTISNSNSIPVNLPPPVTAGTTVQRKDKKSSTAQTSTTPPSSPITVTGPNEGNIAGINNGNQNVYRYGEAEPPPKIEWEQFPSSRLALDPLTSEIKITAKSRFDRPAFTVVCDTGCNVSELIGGPGAAGDGKPVSLNQESTKWRIEWSSPMLDGSYIIVGFVSLDRQSGRKVSIISVETYSEPISR